MRHGKISMDGLFDANDNAVGFTQSSATGAGGGTTQIDWDKGNKVAFTFGAGNETLTFNGPTNPANLLLTLTQDGTGSRTITWPANTSWASGTAPTLTTTASATDLVSFYYDGSVFMGETSLDQK